MVEVMQDYFAKPENNYASLESLSGTQGFSLVWVTVKKIIFQNLSLLFTV